MKHLDGINNTLAFWIRRYFKAIVAVFAAFFVLFLFSAQNTYSVQGCKNMQASILIVDESGENKLSGSSVGALPDSPFKKYVTTISQHILPKIEESALCHGDLKSPPEVKLAFIYRPLIASPKSSIKEPFELKQPPNTFKQLDSPWAKLAISSSPKLVVNAMFVWSERQFLLDQAILSNASTSITNPLLPIDNQAFDKFIQDYTNSVLMATSPETISLAQTQIVKRLPPDVLWLFRHAWQSTFAPFSMEVDNALKETIQRTAQEYINLTTSLLDRTLASKKTEISYASVLNLHDVFIVDRYHINQLH